MTHNLKRKLILFIILITCISPAAGESIRIVTIKVAPFGFNDANGKPTGMMFDISNRIAEEAGFDYTNTLLPYARTIMKLQRGQADFVLRFSNEQLSVIAEPLSSIISMPIILLSQAGNALKTLEHLHGKTVGVIRGGAFDNNFDNDTAIIKYDTNDYSQIIKMLIRGRLDAGIGTNVGLYFSASKLGIKPEVFNPPLHLSAKDFILHFSKRNKNTKTKDALKNSVEKLKASGEIKNIVNSYMGKFKWETPTN
tara:strand:+ start:70 stop:828 length:759 start_codon:yes stop_codon:yes gene_type:complete